MRPIYLASLDKTRPVVVLTRQSVREVYPRVTVAAITSRVRGLSTEVPVGRTNGVDHDSVINCDDINTIEVTRLGRYLGALDDAQDRAVTGAISFALDLD